MSCHSTRFFTTLVFTFFTAAGIAQPSVQTENLARLDSAYEYYQRVFCNGLVKYPDEYRKAKIRNDLQIIRFVNTLFEEQTTEASLDAALNRMRKIRIGKDESQNGLIRLRKIVLNGYYMRAEIDLGVIDTVVLSKNIELTFSTYGRCGDAQWRFLDYKFLREVLIKNISFLVRIRDRDVVADTLLTGKVALAARLHPEYRFNLLDSSNEDWVNKILKKQYTPEVPCCYQRRKGDDDMIALIKGGKMNIIEGLLFSPNYFYALQAMEALIYLASVNKVVIDDTLQNRMDVIRQGKFNIVTQNSFDNFASVEGYKNIHVTNRDIIDKYQFSLK